MNVAVPAVRKRMSRRIKRYRQVKRNGRDPKGVSAANALRTLFNGDVDGKASCINKSLKDQRAGSVKEGNWQVAQLNFAGVASLCVVYVLSSLSELQDNNRAQQIQRTRRWTSGDLMEKGTWVESNQKPDGGRSQKGEENVRRWRSDGDTYKKERQKGDGEG